MHTYAYIRVSAADQNQNRQLDAMTALGIPASHIFTDKQSGKDFNRPAYRALLRKLRPGDMLYIQHIDRLGRDYEEILEQWRVLTKDKGIDIAVTDMPLLDTRQGKDLMGTFIADLVLQILSFVAQNERESIRTRQAQGIAAAQARETHMGRPAKPPPDRFEAIVKKWERGQISTEQALKQCKMGRTTFFRRVREHRELQGNME
ncbi:MAG: recombinase family protein [Oscillospiraceae bacterium]|nr:recombinase family protein [Oscillospiraceae bacterium]